MPHSGGRVGSGIYFASENSKSADYGNNITLLQSEWLNYGYYDINIRGSNLALANLLNANVFPGLKCTPLFANYSLMVILIEKSIREMNLDIYRVIEFIFST